MTDLAKTCIYYRAKHKLSQAEMGKLCGVDRVVILKVEKGRPVSALTEAKIRIVIDNE